MPNELISVRIPDGTGYGLLDIDKKAEGLGFKNKSEFLICAVTLMLQADEHTLLKAKEDSSNRYLPIWANLKIVNK